MKVCVEKGQLLRYERAVAVRDGLEITADRAGQGSDWGGNGGVGFREGDCP